MEEKITIQQCSHFSKVTPFAEQNINLALKGNKTKIKKRKDAYIINISIYIYKGGCGRL